MDKITKNKLQITDNFQITKFKTGYSGHIVPVIPGMLCH